MWKFWLILSGIFLVIEIVTVSFLTFWFAIGALIAMIISFFIDNIVIQSFTFLVSSTLLLFATKPLVNKILSKDEIVSTNSSSISGKIGVVVADIDPIKGIGQIKVETELWSAKTEDGSFIEAGTEVEVKKVDGVKAVVRKINK